MTLRGKKPLNSKAVAAADEEIYSRHENDDRPNPLFDEQGDRRKLSATDPSQVQLRQEWIKLYGKNGGSIQDCSPDSNPPGQLVQPCRDPQATVNACEALLEKFKKEAADLADDKGDPVKNGSEVNRQITKAYAAMYQRRPDLYWAGAATFVSKQMGCNMRYADSSSNLGWAKQLAGRMDGHDIKALAISSKKVLVRGNQAIFKDIYPQYRLYEVSPQCATVHGEDLDLNPKMVAGFQAYAEGNQYQGMMKHADYEQNVVLQSQVMENADIKQDVKNFQEAQNANQERLVRWTRQSQPEQASFSRECVAPGGKDSPYYFQTPPGQFTDRAQRWNMAVPVLDKYNDLMRDHPTEMKQAISGIGQDMESGKLPTY